MIINNKVFKEIFGYSVYYEITGDEEILYNNIFVEDQETIGNYCIVISKDGSYYLGQIINDHSVSCWAKFSELIDAYKAL